MRTNQLAVAVAVAVALVSSVAVAQAPPLTVPQPSPAARVEQTVGLTRLTVDYHRPAVNGRKVWGGLVPYGQVWRAGANENTVFSTSSAIKVAGKPLAAGSYGLHMIPTAHDWTIIFNRVTTGWGSFAYEAKDDVLRVTVHPVATAENEERLSYRFDDPTDKIGDADAALGEAGGAGAHRHRHAGGGDEFDARRAARPVAVLLAAVGAGGDVLDPERRQPRRGAALRRQVDDVRAALRRDPRARRHRREEGRQPRRPRRCAPRRSRSPPSNELNQFGYTLVAQKKLDEAIAIFKTNVKEHPQSWNTYDSLAEAYMTKGDKASALENYTRALSMVKDDANRKRITDTVSKLKN